MRKALFIGGTGTISMAITKLAAQRDWDLYLLNRGTRDQELPKGVKVIKGNIGDEEATKKLLEGMEFDVVADFIVFGLDQLERDIRLFAGKTQQYIFISSASAYQKPLVDPVITEDTPLVNPYWGYSRNKALCEERLMKVFREDGFPFTVVRPSHTYDERSVPVGVHGKGGSYQVIERLRQGKKVIVPGDGTSIWTVTHNSDFAKAFLGLMGNPHAIGQAFHITSDERLTWDQMTKITAQAMGVEAKIAHIPSDVLAKLWPDYEGSLIGDKANSVWFDNEKIKRYAPDFVCTTPFAKGVRLALDYIDQHEECRKPDPEFDAWCDQVIAQYEDMVGKLPHYGE